MRSDYCITILHNLCSIQNTWGMIYASRTYRIGFTHVYYIVYKLYNIVYAGIFFFKVFYNLFFVVMLAVGVHSQSRPLEWTTIWATSPWKLNCMEFRPKYLAEWWTTRLRKALVYQTQGPKMPDTPPACATNGIQHE